jgi:hypothetical protein
MAWQRSTTRASPPGRSTTARRRVRLASRRRSRADRRRQPDALVRLASRLLVAQAGASAAIGISYSRRHLAWLGLTVIVAVALGGLAGLIRSGSHPVWLIAVSAESGLVAVGLFRFVYARYMGGTLLAIATLGTLLHPAVAGAFAGIQPERASAHDHPVLADGGTDALQGPAVG